MIDLRIGVFAAVVVLTGCGQTIERLEGERLTTRAQVASTVAADEASNVPAFSAPAPQANQTWSHQGGNTQRTMGHLALSETLAPVWSVDIGQKEGKRHRITASPVVRDGRIFVMDGRAQVSAVATDGTVLWSKDLTPALESRDDAAGGGMAVGADSLFVTTGFGDIVALTPDAGQHVWTQDLESFGGSSPTLYDDLVYVAARDGAAWAINRETGRVKWQLAGPPSTTGYIGGPGPAVTSKWAVFPFSTGEILSTYRKGGLRNWTASISGRREGAAAGVFNDLTGNPVIDGNRVYVGNAAGRITALDLQDGSFIWTQPEGVRGTIWPAGGSLFFVNDQNSLLRLDAQTGETLWSKELPLFTHENPKRRNGVHAHFGPILAGGRLIVASSDGLMRAFDPATGAMIASYDLPGGAASAPVVAGKTLYVVTRDGTLHAFR